MNDPARRKKIKLMEVCGTHTMAIARAGIKALLPESVELVSGPGCPVCVTDAVDIDRAVEICRRHDVIMTTFGDMLRVPGSRGSLAELKREGRPVRIVYSCLDALEIARRNPKGKVVFLGVGFETTSPTVAATVLQARREGIRNFFLLANFKLVFPALELLARSRRLGIDGFLCPGHVSVITGSRPYERVARLGKKPCVIAGFEPADIVAGIEKLLRQIRDRRHQVQIEYTRAVTRQGNLTAQKVLHTVLRTSDARWRGLGVIKKSGLTLRPGFASFSAEKRFPVTVPKVRRVRGCLCGEVLKGLKGPADCRLLKTSCTPEHPVGPCMVSSEGACAAYARYGR